MEFSLKRLIQPVAVYIVFALPFDGLCQIDPNQIEIIRDPWGVPHIYGRTDAETAFGLAWANAEDDFATMQLTILAAKAKAGEVFGKTGAAADYFVQLIRAKELVSREIKSLPPDFLALLSGYVEGINAYATSHPEEITLKGSFPITVEEMLRAYVLSLSSISGATTAVSNLYNNREQNSQGDWEESRGSNAIAIDNTRTVSGETFLAINSHQPLEGPDSWYEVHLNSEEGWNILGGTFPGGAMIFHGVNESLGWAHTVNYPDKVDVFKLNMVTGEDDHYFLDGESKALEVRKIKLKVKVFLGIKLGVNRKVYWSEFGPVIKNKSGYYAVRFGSMMNLDAPVQWYRMNKANDWQEFREALELCALPGFNIIYADKDSNIFFTSMAMLPRRKTGYNWKGTVPGYTSEVIWNEFHPLQNLPQILNPESGILFNANNTVFNASGSGDNISIDQIDPTMGFPKLDNNRSIRFQNLLFQEAKLSFDRFKEIKYDLQLPDTLHYSLNLNPLFQVDPAQYSDIEDYLRLLQKWDRKADVKSTGATLFKAVYDSYVRNEKIRDSDDPLFEAVREARKALIKEYKGLNIPLGEYQTHIRGSVQYGIAGIPDVVASMSTKRDKKGHEVAFQGESYVMMVRFTDKGPIIETVNAYGASNRSDSPHYTDQMELFVNQRLKPMSLSREEIQKNAERVYHPMK